MKLPFEPYITRDTCFKNSSNKKRRMTTFVIPWPTVKLAELRTHRTICQMEGELFLTSNDKTVSMNANSSRAIPLERQIKQVEECPFEPIWTLNQKGMSGNFAPDPTAQKASEQWHSVRAFTLTRVKELLELGIHKQDAALLLNPFSWTTCILSASEDRWQHFFGLRCNSNVYPAVREICQEMESLMIMNDPDELEIGQMHIAFYKEAREVVIKAMENGEITPEDVKARGKLYQIAVSMSMCAMISYDTQERSESLEKHLKRAAMLITEGHWSTAEHQFIQVVYPDNTEGIYNGWKSMRNLIEDHNSLAKDFINAIY